MAKEDDPSKKIDDKKDAKIDNFFSDLKIEAVHNAVFDMNAAALNHDNMKLSPIIFSHGLVMSSADYSRHNLELASHGYIVFSMNHNDGSCSYTEKSDGTAVFFDRSVGMSQFPTKEPQYLQTR